MAHLQTDPTAQSATGSRSSLSWAAATLLASGLGLAGSLYLSIGAGLKACPLCFYQRTFVMAVVAVLAVGLVADRRRAGFLCLLSLPLAWAGLGVAAFHEYLVLAGKLECPAGLLGLGTIPAQSLALFVLLVIGTAIGAWTGRQDRACGPLLLGGGVLGLLLAWGAVASAPPLPAAPGKPYDDRQPLDTCRPPYRPANGS